MSPIFLGPPGPKTAALWAHLLGRGVGAEDEQGGDVRDAIQMSDMLDI